MTASDVSTTSSRNLGRFVERYGIIGVVIVMMIALYAMEPEVFLSLQNLTNILRQIAMNALLAMGMFLVILTAGIDLSVGSVLALAMMSLAMADQRADEDDDEPRVSGLVGIAAGLFNG
ncbi:MAG: ABC transporter permease, partial [Bauldia sp.]